MQFLGVVGRGGGGGGASGAFFLPAFPRSSLVKVFSGVSMVSQARNHPATGRLGSEATTARAGGYASIASRRASEQYVGRFATLLVSEAVGDCLV